MAAKAAQQLQSVKKLGEEAHGGREEGRVAPQPSPVKADGSVCPGQGRGASGQGLSPGWARGCGPEQRLEAEMPLPSEGGRTG